MMWMGIRLFPLRMVSLTFRWRGQQPEREDGGCLQEVTTVCCQRRVIEMNIPILSVGKVGLIEVRPGKGIGITETRAH